MSNILEGGSQHVSLKISEFVPILVVSFLMIIQVALCQECGAAPTLHTHIRPETCVGADVSLEIALFVEALAAGRKWTDEGFDSLL